MLKKLSLLFICIGFFFIAGCQSTIAPTISEEKSSDVIQMVTISINCQTILNNRANLKPGYDEFVPSDGIILDSLIIEFEDNNTVLDILKKATSQQGIPIDVQGSYVQSINHLPQFACGDASGWMYGVNGAYVNQSAGKKTLQNGDVIQWVFTCNNGKDVSF